MKTPHTHTSSCQDILPHGRQLPREEVNVCMTIPNILALDFDGVLCDGMHEYFEASRRSYMRIWPDEPVPGDDLFPAFRALRPVIMTGWEMPLLLRTIVQERPESAILQNWAAIRGDLLKARQLHGAALISALTRTLDEVRRTWIAIDPL